MNMKPKNNYKNYQQVQIETSKPERLICMLFEGAVKYLLLAKEEKVSSDIWKFRLNILKVQSMVLELIASLNFDNGGEIAITLHRLYIYIIDKLSQTLESEEKDIAKVDEVLSLLVPLKDTWSEAVKMNLNKEQPGDFKIKYL